MNYRSIPEINAVSSVISGKNISSKKTNFNQNLGAFFVTYDPKNPVLLKELFSNKISQCNISSNNAAILCRSNEMVNKLTIENSSLGQGKIKLLTNAAIQRDLHRDYNTAFNLVTKCIVGLLINPPNDLYNKILQSNRFFEFYDLKKDIWSFIRDAEKGLPLSSLNAKQDWVKILRTNLEELLNKCNQRYGFEILPNINSVLSTRGLSNSPLYSLDVTSTKDEKLRVDTVHKSKGESIDAVLYIANGNHIEAMLDGVNTETGRIGYVALTRARNLFILGVPNNKTNTIRTKLIDLGFKEIEVENC
ncbi:TPA: hypothetical protein JBB12_15755 [Legionella pneumophila subsp. pneumophila]|nr:hypothetical protein [Legionella pneumophila subsp. pneumophila]